MAFNFGTAIGLASVAVSAYSAYKAGQAQEQAGALDAESYRLAQQQREENAQLIEQQTAQQEQLRVRQLGQTLATNRATAAALGYDVTSSASFRAAQRDTVSAADFDVSNIRLTGTLAAKRETIGAAQSGLAAQSALAGGRAAGTIGLLSSVSEAGTGLWDLYKAS